MPFDLFSDFSGEPECYDWPNLVPCFEAGGSCDLPTWEPRERQMRGRRSGRRARTQPARLPYYKDGEEPVDFPLTFAAAHPGMRCFVVGALAGIVLTSIFKGS